MDLNTLLAQPVALPSIPKVAAVLLSELSLDTPDLRKVTQVISTDPALTARLLQLANASHFNMSGKVNSVSEALALLKLQHVRAMAQEAAATSSMTPIRGIQMRQFWDYSLSVARLSRSLAGLVRQNQSAAFTCGLLHAVGELVMHLGMPDQMALMAKSAGPLSLKRARAERRALGYCYAQVGAGLAEQWHFPQAMVDALGYQQAPFENFAYEPLAGVIHLAAWRARARLARMSPKQLADSFPGAVGEVLEMDIDMVLQQDPFDWSSPSPEVLHDSRCMV